MTKDSESIPSYQQTEEKLKHYRGLLMLTFFISTYFFFFRSWENRYLGSLQKDCLVIKRLERQSHETVHGDTEFYT